MTEAEILELTYFDRCTIKRKVKVKDEETGITSTKLITVSENVKCALNKKDSKLIISDGLGKIVGNDELYVNPSTDIKEGDIVEVSSMGKLLIYLASKPFLYPSHAIIPLTIKERV